MLYLREILFKKGYKKCTRIEGRWIGANVDKRIDKFDEKTIKPFIAELQALYEKHGLMVVVNNDGTPVITNFDKDDFAKIRTAEIDVL